MYDDGMNVNQIAKKVNRPHSTVWYIVARESGRIERPKFKR